MNIEQLQAIAKTSPLTSTQRREKAEAQNTLGVYFLLAGEVAQGLNYLQYSDSDTARHNLALLQAGEVEL